MSLAQRTSNESNEQSRRLFLAYFNRLGLATTLLPGALWTQIQQSNKAVVTKEILAHAETVAGVQFTDEQRDFILAGVNEYLKAYDSVRKFSLPNDVPVALHFNPVLPQMRLNRTRKKQRWSKAPRLARPTNIEDVAFWPVTDLAVLLKSRQLRSIELTELYLSRLERYGPMLECVVTITRDLALRQAAKADNEIAAGRHRGILHGIPWGAKDLISKAGYRTTWGAGPFKERIIDEDATVVRRLEEAGAVLVAKLSTGELAFDNVWFGGRTRNPWNVSEGSNGSSAGPASATAAGLVGFAIGTETGGSILFPAVRCGATGLRPTFGRVSRHGVMTAAGSMDKVGPFGRSVEDCAAILNAIQGPDGLDPTVVDMPFNWDALLEPQALRVGYVESAFGETRQVGEEKTNDDATLQKLRDMGVQLVPVELPALPAEPLGTIAFAEMAASFDELIRKNDDRLLARQGREGLGAVYRAARLIPAVEYLQANRLRTKMMEALARLMDDIDVYLAPVGTVYPAPAARQHYNLMLTNATGHPAVAVPNGFTQKETPTGISFVGRLYGEATMLALAKAYQDATGYHKINPKL